MIRELSEITFYHLKLPQHCLIYIYDVAIALFFLHNSVTFLKNLFSINTRACNPLLIRKYYFLVNSYSNCCFDTRFVNEAIYDKSVNIIQVLSPVYVCSSV